MFCTNCGTGIDMGEHICKGCGKLDAGLQDELLAMSEKTTGVKCEKCGGPLHIEHLYCGSCGTKVAC